MKREMIKFKDVPPGNTFTFKGVEYKRINDLGQIIGFFNAKDLRDGHLCHFGFDFNVSYTNSQLKSIPV